MGASEESFLLTLQGLSPHHLWSWRKEATWGELNPTGSRLPLEAVRLCVLNLGRYLTALSLC